MTVRLGLAGAGRWGRNVLRTVAEEVPGAEVSSVLVRTPREVEGASPSVVTTDAEKFFSSCDAVIVATPPDSHEPLAVWALESGLPVMVEKPAAPDLAATERMFGTAALYSLPLLVDHVHLFSDAFLEFHATVAGRGFSSLSSWGGGPGPARDYSPLLDWGPHEVSMALSLFGPVDVSVGYCGFLDLHGGVLYDLTLLDGDRRSSHLFGTGYRRKVKRFTATTPGGEFSYERRPDGTSAAIVQQGRSVYRGDRPLTSAVRSFVSVVRGSEPDWRYEPSLSLSTVRLLDEAAATATPLGRSLPPP